MRVRARPRGDPDELRRWGARHYGRRHASGGLASLPRAPPGGHQKELPSQNANSSSLDLAESYGTELGLTQAAGTMPATWNRMLRGALDNMQPQSRDPCARQLFFLRLHYPPPRRNTPQRDDMAARLLDCLETAYPPTQDEYIDGMDIRNPWPRPRTGATQMNSLNQRDAGNFLQTYVQGTSHLRGRPPSTSSATTTQQPANSPQPPPLHEASQEQAGAHRHQARFRLTKGTPRPTVMKQRRCHGYHHQQNHCSHTQGE